MLASGVVYRFIVRALGWFHLLLGAATLGGLSLLFETVPATLAAAAVLGLPGLVMAVPALSPRILTHPDGFGTGFVGLMMLVAMTQGGALAAYVIAHDADAHIAEAMALMAFLPFTLPGFGPVLVFVAAWPSLAKRIANRTSGA